MRRVFGVVMSLVAVSWVSVPSFAQPADAPAAAPPAAAPAPPHKRQPWKERLDREPLPDPELQVERSWYGWQTLLIDGLSVGAGALIGAATQQIDGGFWLGAVLFAIGSPLVHFAHLNVTEGFSSLGMRALPSGLVAFGLAINQEREGVGYVLLGLIGAVIVMAVDATVFAWDEERGKQPRAWLTPWLDPQRGRFGLGYASCF